MQGVRQQRVNNLTNLDQEVNKDYNKIAIISRFVSLDSKTQMLHLLALGPIKCIFMLITITIVMTIWEQTKEGEGAMSIIMINS